MSGKGIPDVLSLMDMEPSKRQASHMVIERSAMFAFERLLGSRWSACRVRG